MNSTAISIIIVGLLVGGLIVFSRPNDNSNTPSAPLVNNVSVEGKDQIVEITAKGGYTPKVSAAKAEMPTILRMKTQSTYDCTSSINIPTLGIKKILPSNGVTDISIPPQKLGTRLNVLCAMGMYTTAIDFN